VVVVLVVVVLVAVPVTVVVVVVLAAAAAANLINHNLYCHIKQEKVLMAFNWQENQLCAPRKIIYLSMALQPFVGPWPCFSFLV
jgi:hypothetical protein